MYIFHWLTCFISRRGMGMAIYKRGMAKAKKHDHQGAIDDYTTLIRTPRTPAELKAMALYNRALVHVAAGDDRKGVDDLDAVLAMEEAIVNVKTMARQKLARMASPPSRSNK